MDTPFVAADQQKGAPPPLTRGTLLTRGSLALLALFGISLIAVVGSIGSLHDYVVPGEDFSKTSKQSPNVTAMLARFQERYNMSIDPMSLHTGYCPGVTVYWHAYYGGRWMRLGTGAHNIYRMGWNDVISSMRIPDGCWVWACRDVFCQNHGHGGSSDFIRNVPWMAQFNDWVSYMHVYSYNRRNFVRAMLYKDCHNPASYGWFAPPGYWDLRALKAHNIGNDAISEFDVLPQAVLYMWKHDHYTGTYFIDYGPITDCCGSHANNQISSIWIGRNVRAASANQSVDYTRTMGNSAADAQPLLAV